MKIYVHNYNKKKVLSVSAASYWEQVKYPVFIFAHFRWTALTLHLHEKCKECVKNV